MVSDEVAQEVMTTLEQVVKDYTEKSEAYMELVSISTRMADKLPEDDPDRMALEAMFMFHLADSTERARRMAERKQSNERRQNK